MSDYELGEEVEVTVPEGGVRVNYTMKFDNEETRLLAEAAAFHGLTISAYVRETVLERARLPRVRFEVPV